MSEPAQLTLRQARSWLRKRMPEIERITAELNDFLGRLPAPSPAELKAMEAREQPVTREAHLVATVRLIAFYLAEAWTDTEAYFECSPSFAKREGLSPYLLQSLKYVVEDRAREPLDLDQLWDADGAELSPQDAEAPRTGTA